jgi:hypothetical protein
MELVVMLGALLSSRLGIVLPELAAFFKNK